MKWNCDNLKTLSIREIFDSEIKLRRFKNFLARKIFDSIISYFYYIIYVLVHIIYLFFFYQ